MRGFQFRIWEDLTPRSMLGAFFVMALAVLVRAAIDQPVPGLPYFITLYPAVACAGLMCGPISGGVATIFGILAALFLWIPPRFSIAITSMNTGVSVSLFALASFLVLLAVAAVRSQLNAATIARHALDLGLRAGGVGIWEMDLRTRRITASSTANALHRLPEGKTETVAEDWLIGVHPDDIETARGVLQAAVADGSLATYTYRIFGTADEPRWISARGRVVSTGGKSRLLCAFVDITEEVRVQDELRRERERLRLALAAGALAVWDFNLATGEAAIDTQYAATLGFDPGVKSLTRAQIGDRIHPQDRARVAAAHEAAVSSGGDYRIEYRVIAQESEIRWVVSQGQVVAGGRDFQAGRIVGVIQDVTDRKRHETELRELAAARELLIREADHRIKNSLQMVISLLTMQLRGITDPDAVAALRSAITRVGAIAASHLALQGSEDFREIDLALILREVCKHFSHLQPHISIICRVSQTLLLDADRAIPLGLVVSEVLTNALRHGFAGRVHGAVTVYSLVDSGTLIVRVSDDGIGMQSKQGELGLGSRIIRDLAAQIGASTEVNSTADTGTIVTIRLPLAPAQTGMLAAGN